MGPDLVAVLEYTVVSVSVAVPRMKSPPPCQLQEQGQSPLGRWMKCLGRFKIQALTHCDANVMSTRTTAGQFKCEFKGAMEEMSQTVQNANTHILRCQNHEHAHSSRSVQGSVQWGDG